MEFTQESIDALVVNEVDIMKKIAEELNIRVSQVSAVISLINEDCTIAFISRYRKDKTDNLNEVEVAECDHKFKSYKNLEERRLEIVRGIFGQGKLTESLYNAVMGAKTLTELEDLWAPFKKKKKTRGMVAIEKGLEPLADFMEGQNDDAAVEAEAQKFIKTDNEDAALNVESFMDAIAGAQDIIAERTSQNPQNRSDVHDLYMAEGTIETKGIVPEGVDAETAEKTSTYKMYWDYSESLNQVKPHRILAMNRAEREGALSVNINVPVDGAIALLQKKAKPSNKYHNDAIEDGLVRLLSPAVVREIRSNETDEADDHGIELFSENLKNLLMTQPIKGSRVLGVDPGYRNGTKCAALDETGKFLGFFKIFQEQNPQDAYEQINNAIDKYDIQVIAVGNGTGSQEVQAIVSKVLSENYSDSDVKYTVVDESGASVYSASPVATEEFPELDVMVRGAISMGRRLQDPLAELVKIDPKAIGVGLYQHDVNQKKLAEQLDEVVSSVVNNVGVNLNTASYMLLKYVSGINLSTAKKIVAYRDANGKIKSREELKKVPGIGPKAFEQCAGFLKIAESSDPLDNTWVHPENYEVAREVLSYVQQKKAVPADVKKSLCEKYSVGETTLNDIIEELGKPNRDPRDGYPAPIMQKGVVNFEDLTVGMKVTGKIKNVVDFGAFVDIGLHETALIHVSELSDNFVSDPMDVVKVGDVKEFTIIDLDKDRKRISLSLKSDAHTRLGQTNEGKKPKATDGSAPRRKVVVVKKGGEKPREAAFAGSKRSNANRGSDDGLSYNPFAAFFNNQK
ncbi:MAG: Tex family protein [Treponema berlinense]|uniref:helix-hairpin-helix domain-containing protein n=1 Tax=Treponema TaxID=157 RepID=UPI002356B1DC|nr:MULTISPECIES: Tex family protein [Treponema]MBQ9102915.1 RNA-binding transcriptional accessory protein [Treponema sp.]MCI5540987.1 RNA-binding transcriptional accessory protein [Treponema berlinense]MDD5833785.1 Tex family protein [Treponema berlinense]MDY3707072.1 Tex family protein [Treponema berlinense]